jgi:CIC family chloride channel protein
VSAFHGPMPTPTPLSLSPQPAAPLQDHGPTETLREERFFLILSVFLGVFAGLAVVTLRIVIDWSKLIFLGPDPANSPLRLVIAPTIVGLAVAVLVIHVFPTARGSGVTQTKSALYILNGYISIRTTIGKFVLSALAIGSGQSLGPEDPSLQVGAGLASSLGRRLHLSRNKLRLIAPVCGPRCCIQCSHISRPLCD